MSNYRNDPLLNNLVFWAGFDAGQPRNLIGCSGGILSNLGTSLVNGPTPKINGIQFTTGSGKGIVVDETINQSMMTYYTSVAFWEKNTAGQANNQAFMGSGIVAVGLNWTLTCGWGTGNGGKLGLWDNSTLGPYLSSNNNSLSDGNWHHVVFTRSSTATKLYIDRAFDSSGPAGGASRLDERLGLGRFNGLYNTYQFNWVGADIRVYNRELSAGEVADVYNYAFQPIEPPLMTRLPSRPYWPNASKFRLRVQVEDQA